MAELVTIKTRVKASTMRRLVSLSRRNERSVAAELRVAVDAHLTDAPSGKDGRK